MATPSRYHGCPAAISAQVSLTFDGFDLTNLPQTQAMYLEGFSWYRDIGGKATTDQKNLSGSDVPPPIPARDKQVTVELIALFGIHPKKSSPQFHVLFYSSWVKARPRWWCHLHSPTNPSRSPRPAPPPSLSQPTALGHSQERCVQLVAI